MKVLSEAYVPVGITSGDLVNMLGQITETHKITFQEYELPPKELGHNKGIAYHCAIREKVHSHNID